MTRFHDHFSSLAEAYVRYRPTYPAAIHDFLAASVDAHDRAWDVATGSGQAATSLAERFREVIATDASAAQIAHALPHERVDYRVERASQTAQPDASVDLCTIAAALHWLDREAFYAEVRRVVRPGGVFAAWTYTTEMWITPAVDRAVGAVIDDTLAPFWAPEFGVVRDGYRSIDLPWPAAEDLTFELALQWSVDDLLGHIDTWSASGRHAAERNEPVSAVVGDAIRRAWGDAQVRRVVVPIRLRWCRRPTV
jgi:SAM-dependent methyltransferase